MQLNKQSRKQRGNAVRTQVVKLEKFNPVVPKGIEITWATLKGEHVVVRTQPRATQ